MSMNWTFAAHVASIAVPTTPGGWNPWIYLWRLALKLHVSVVGIGWNGWSWPSHGWSWPSLKLNGWVRMSIPPFCFFFRPRNRGELLLFGISGARVSLVENGARYLFRSQSPCHLPTSRSRWHPPPRTGSWKVMANEKKESSALEFIIENCFVVFFQFLVFSVTLYNGFINALNFIFSGIVLCVFCIGSLQNNQGWWCIWIRQESENFGGPTHTYFWGDSLSLGFLLFLKRNMPRLGKTSQCFPRIYMVAFVLN